MDFGKITQGHKILQKDRKKTPHISIKYPNICLDAVGMRYSLDEPGGAFQRGVQMHFSQGDNMQGLNQVDERSGHLAERLFVKTTWGNHSDGVSTFYLFVEIIEAFSDVFDVILHRVEEL